MKAEEDSIASEVGLKPSLFASVGIERDDSSARAIATKDSCKKVEKEECEEE